MLSCSDDDNIKQTPLSEGEVWCSVYVNMDKDKGKAFAETDNNDERRINSARIVFYLNDYVQYVFDYKIITDFSSPSQKIKGDGIVTSDVLDGFRIEPVTIRKGNYKIAAFINPGTTVKAVTEKGKALSELYRTVTISSINDLIGAQGNDFYMANASGLVPTNDNQFYSTLSAAIAQSANRPQIMVERAVAKIVFTLDSSISGKVITVTEGSATYDLDLSKLQWTVDVKNRKAFWLRKMTYKKGGEDNALPNKNMELPGDYQTVLNSASVRSILYAEDPNFEGYSNNINPVDEFEYCVVTDDSMIEWKKPDELFYVPENTMHNDDFKFNLSTQILFKIPYNLNTGNMYYRIPIRHFADEPMQEVGSKDGDNENPGSGDEEASGGGFVGSAARAWGVWGIVRNNTYKIKLNSISKAGETVLKEPADKQNEY